MYILLRIFEFASCLISVFTFALVTVGCWRKEQYTQSEMCEIVSLMLPYVNVYYFLKRIKRGFKNL